MLTVENVSAGYNGVDVVKNVSFTVNPNENLSIIGPNGCGKTTLLKAIVKLLPFKGSILVGGKSVKSIKSKDLSLKIAMLGQVMGIYFSYSVFDTVMMGRYPHIKGKLLGLPSDEDKEITLRCLCAVGLEAEKDREITKLSGGQLQRVFLARTLAQNPDIILLDEPTNHLDLKLQIEFIDYLKKWAEDENRAVVGVLHDINLALRLSDNILVMKDGETMGYGKTSEIITDELLEQVYDIDVAGYMRETLGRWI